MNCTYFCNGRDFLNHFRDEFLSSLLFKALESEDILSETWQRVRFGSFNNRLTSQWQSGRFEALEKR